jgi:hypothetical protein
MLASLALPLCACAADKSHGIPPLAVKMPSVCERLLPPIALPPIAATDDARVAFVKDDAALIKARAEIERGRHCVIEQRELYAAPKGSRSWPFQKTP